MINVILYGECSNYIKVDMKIINMALARYNVDYRISVFSDYNDEFETVINNMNIKIYVLDINSGGKGIEVALEIRKKEKNSIIILIADCNKYQRTLFENRLMVLDFICRNSCYEKRLYDDIIYAIKIILEKKFFVFKYNHVLYQIPYSRINYIEKEQAIKRCIIHTVDENYYVVNSIQKIYEILGSSFFKSHKSCIVNLGNIKRIDLVNNIVEFNNGEYTILISEKLKKDLVSELNGY